MLCENVAYKVKVRLSFGHNRSRAASRKESEQGKIDLAEHVVSWAEPFKECYS